MEEVRKVEGLSVEELEDQSVELLPDREELHHRGFNLFSKNFAASAAVNGSASVANAGNVFIND